VLRDRAARHSILVLAIAALVLLGGCASSAPRWVDSGGAYTKTTVSSVLAKADISRFAGQSASDTAKARHDALTELRKRGGAASDAADLITKTLPADTRGIPAYVERATFDQQPAVILVEAIGPPQGKLTTKRLWVIGETGGVLFVGTR
jgi:hypothetical protein